MDNAYANAVKSFAKDAEEFKKVLQSITDERDTFRNFYNLSWRYKGAYLPLAFFIKRIGKWCDKERRKLDERVEVLEKICSIYAPIIDIAKKPDWEGETKAVIIRLLDELASKLQKHKERMRDWHPILKNNLLNTGSAYSHAKSLCGLFQ